MSLVQTVENRVNNTFRIMVAMWFGLFSITSCIVIFMFPVNAAHAAMMVEPIGAQIRTDLSRTNNTETSPSSRLAQGADNSDPCLSLIPSPSVSSKNAPKARHNVSLETGVYTLDQRNAKNQSALSPAQAGKTAALGLMFGVRFALIPSRKLRTPKVKSKSPSPILAVYRKPASLPFPKALSIAAYRSCKKDLALSK